MRIALPSNWIICERGGAGNNHETNQDFRVLVFSQVSNYINAANRAEKSKIAKDIFDSLNEDGFVFKSRDVEKMNDGNDMDTFGFARVRNTVAIKKVKQTFRDCKDHFLKLQDEEKSIDGEEAVEEENTMNEEEATEYSFEPLPFSEKTEDTDEKETAEDNNMDEEETIEDAFEPIPFAEDLLGDNPDDDIMELLSTLLKDENDVDALMMMEEEN